MKKKLIVFDLDGVLFNSVKYVNDYLFRTYPTMTPEIMGEILSGNFHEEIKKFRSQNGVAAESLEDKNRRKAEFTLNNADVPLYAGMKELLQDLHNQGCILTINTSAASHNCLPLLERAGVSDLFDFIGTVETSESKIEKFRIIQQKYAIPAEDTLFVTDTLGDVREADAVGVPTVAVTWGAHNRSYFKREPIRCLIGLVDSVPELKTFAMNL